MAGELHKGEGLRDVATAGQARGTFSFDEDDLRSLIRKWEDLAYDYENSRREADAMKRIDGPGLDFASDGMRKAAISSGNAYLAYLAHNRDYCQRQADLFQAALDEYLGVEHANATEFDTTGQGGPQAGI